MMAAIRLPSCLCVILLASSSSSSSFFFAAASVEVVTRDDGEAYRNATQPTYMLAPFLEYEPSAVVYPATAEEAAGVVADARAAARNGSISVVGGRHGSAGYCFSGKEETDTGIFCVTAFRHTHGML